VKRPKLTTADRFLWAWLLAVAVGGGCRRWLSAVVVGGLDGLETERNHMEVGNGDRLVPQGIPPVLDLEDSPRKAGTTSSPGGCPIFNSCDEPRQPALGSHRRLTTNG